MFCREGAMIKTRSLRHLLWLALWLALLSACSTSSPSPDLGTSPPVAPPGGGTPPPPPQSGILTAADIDDNLNFAAFQKYLNSISQADTKQVLPGVSLADRVSVRVLDSKGVGVANAKVKVFSGQPESLVMESAAGANGVFYFFPGYDGAGSTKKFRLEVTPPTGDTPKASLNLDLDTLPENRRLETRLEGLIAERPAALDLMLVIDATGSMGDEMRYLTTEFRDIVSAIKDKFPAVSLRFGLIVYRDIGDEFVVRSFDFTDSVETMRGQLEKQVAAGGGDYPEAMEQAIEQATKAQWRSGNINRLIFLVGDAPPHDENLPKALTHAKAVRKLGIRFYPLAASGVADTAEYLMRIMAASTHGRHLFLTDDSGVGNPHQQPKVPCFVVTRLDHLLIRVIASEMSGVRVEPTQDQIVRSVGQQQDGGCVK